MIAIVHTVEESRYCKDKDQGSAVYASWNKLSPCWRTAYKLDTANYRRYNPYSVSCHICHMFDRCRSICLIYACSRIHPLYPISQFIIAYFVLFFLLAFLIVKFTKLNFIKLHLNYIEKNNGIKIIELHISFI